MIRINLLPPEIIERRKDEGRWRWVVIGAIALLVVLAGVFLILEFQLSIKRDEVAGAKQTAEGIRQQTERFKVFQEKKADLANRRAIADKALNGRMDWAKVLAEVALVMPSDLYLVRMGVTEPKPAVPGVAGAPGTPAAPGKLTLDGRALDVPNDVPDLGYRSIAKLLVRLSELEQLDAVWLSNSVKPSIPSEGTAPTIDMAFSTFVVSADIYSTTTTVTP